VSRQPDEVVSMRPLPVRSGCTTTEEDALRYLLLIYEDESHWASLPAEERRRQIAGYDAVRTLAQERGQLVAADGLAGVAHARTVRRRNGMVAVTDGPFAETKEALGGFYLVDCSEAEALAYAEAVPAVEAGSVEVRPVGVAH